LPLAKWDIIRVWRSDLSCPHDKFCICLCPVNNLFVYINSNPPEFRKKRDAAVEVDNFELNCLSHMSYIDVSSIIDDLPDDELEKAINDSNRCHGPIPPSIRDRIKASVSYHRILSPVHMALFDD
jgi:hypothetical protein